MSSAKFFPLTPGKSTSHAIKKTFCEKSCSRTCRAYRVAMFSVPEMELICLLATSYCKVLSTSYMYFCMIKVKRKKSALIFFKTMSSSQVFHHRYQGGHSSSSSPSAPDCSRNNCNRMKVWSLSTADKTF